MDKKSKSNDDDKDAFLEAMRGVKRITYTKIVKKPKPPTKRPRQRREEVVETFPFSDYETLPLLGSEDFVQFARPGLQHKILRNLRLGQYNVEAVLDLHGMTVEQAREALGQFLSRCQPKGIRHVLMIHGKGRANSKPILKNKLNHWLRQTEQVLAFCSATQKDGKTGAMYVLLGRKGIAK